MSIFPKEDPICLKDILDNNFKVANFLQTDLSQFKNIDIVIGNPPYQEEDNGYGASAKPIYNLFIEKIIEEIEPTYFSFIIPSRWMTGGKGLDKFRKKMLKDTHFKYIYDFKDDKECFPSVSIEGGVCYFLWDKNYSGLCSYIEMKNGEISSVLDRNLNEFDIFIRDNRGYEILKKIINKSELLKINFFISNIKRPTFGFNTNFNSFYEKNDIYNIPLFGNQLLVSKEKRNRDNPIGYVSAQQIKGDLNKINSFKVLVAKARGGISKDKKILSKPILTPDKSVCSQTFVILYSTDNEEKAKIIKSYIETKFFRFLVSLRKLTQDLSISVYAFIPDIYELFKNNNLEINDLNLYNIFELSEDDQIYIENKIDLF